jgi:hypothetical protein
MVGNLSKLGYISFEKYGCIRPTEKGSLLGNYLLLRHDILMDFFCLINNSTDQLEQVEKIEHYIDEKTVYNLERAYKLLNENTIKKRVGSIPARLYYGVMPISIRKVDKMRAKFLVYGFFKAFCLDDFLILEWYYNLAESESG